MNNTALLRQLIREIISEATNRPRAGMKSRWSLRRKRNINCSRPRGFSQRNYCRRQRRGGHYRDE